MSSSQHRQSEGILMMFPAYEDLWRFVGNTHLPIGFMIFMSHKALFSNYAPQTWATGNMIAPILLYLFTPLRRLTRWRCWLMDPKVDHPTGSLPFCWWLTWQFGSFRCLEHNSGGECCAQHSTGPWSLEFICIMYIYNIYYIYIYMCRYYVFMHVVIASKDS